MALPSVENLLYPAILPLTHKAPAVTQSPLISAKTAQTTAQTALLQHFGTQGALTLLNPSSDNQASFVFRADLGAQGFAIVKVGDPARMALAAVRQLTVYPSLSEGRYRVPQLLAQDADNGVTVSEDARGQSAQTLFLSGPAGAARALAAAGGWIARFHKPTAHMGAFNPDPHLNWLQKQAAAHQDRTRQIPDFEKFDRALNQAIQAAIIARWQPILRAITHRDYHLRNLLIRNLGRTYGIDFENAKRDEALRDLLFFTADAAKIATAPPTAESLRAIAQTLRIAYNRPLGAKPSRQMFQTAFALAGWANLDTAQSKLGPNRARALAVMQLMVTTVDLFADP